MIALDFIKEGHPKKTVLEVLGIPRSSFYYKPKPNRRKGITKSTHTPTRNGNVVSNEKVIEDIEYILSKEFVDYGYLKVTHWLRQQRNYIINPKKVYRIMREEGLLNKVTPRKKNQRNWVKELLPPAKDAFDYLEFDIKYFYVAGKNRNALSLTVIDVKSRWVLGQYMAWVIKKTMLLIYLINFSKLTHYPKAFTFEMIMDHNS